MNFLSAWKNAVIHRLYYLVYKCAATTFNASPPHYIMHLFQPSTFFSGVAILMPAVQAGFWRMNCGKILTGRVDPVGSPSSVSSHVHNIVGGYSKLGQNWDAAELMGWVDAVLNSSSEEMAASKCTSCEIAA